MARIRPPRDLKLLRPSGERGAQSLDPLRHLDRMCRRASPEDNPQWKREPRWKSVAKHPLDGARSEWCRRSFEGSAEETPNVDQCGSPNR